MAIEVFSRFEKKYLFDEKIFTKVKNRLSDYMEPDVYNNRRETYTIANLYYDTAGSDMIRRSLQKQRYKEKLRIRAYGVPYGHSEVYVEIKKKVSGIVNKRRTAMKRDEAYEFLQSGTLPEPQPYMNNQVLREIVYLLERFELMPMLYLAYDRRAYLGTKQHDLRVSFDTNIRTRRHDLRLESGAYGEHLLPEGVWLMEIKAARSIPVWICRLLSEYNVYPMSFSKYGTEFMQSLSGKIPQKELTALPRICSDAVKELRPAASY